MRPLQDEQLKGAWTMNGKAVKQLHRVNHKKSPDWVSATEPEIKWR